jgi:hypothetical protein
MRAALVAFVIFLAGLTPGLLKHGQPHSYGGQAPSVAASDVPDKSAHPLLAFLQRWKPA